MLEQNVTEAHEDGEPPRKKRGRPPKNRAPESYAPDKDQDNDNDDNDEGADPEFQPAAVSQSAPGTSSSTAAPPIPRKRGRPPKTTS